MGGETESAGQKARPVFNRLGGRRKAKGAIFGRKPRLTPRQQRDAINRRDMDEAVFAPARRSRRMLLAYSCVKFACFICPSRWRPDSNSAWSKIVWAGHSGIALGGVSALSYREGFTRVDYSGGWSAR
jgi:hypothetical protein